MKRLAVAGISLWCAFLAIVGCERGVFVPAPQAPETLSVIIDRPPLVIGEQQYGPVISFGWRGDGETDPAFTRYLWTAVIDTNGTYYPPFDIIGDLNKNPWRYEHLWSEWRPYVAPGDSGRSTILGDDETLTLGRYYIFGVQVRDALGAVTDTFVANENIRRFRIKSSSGPFLRIYEPYLVGFRFLGNGMRIEERELPPGIPLRFRWLADVSDYSGNVVGYRYGWDIPDPSAWDAPYDPGITAAPEVSFSAGAHTLFVEAIDLAGAVVRGRVTIRVKPWPMDRDLLFIDDFVGAPTAPADYSQPSESQDRQYWTNICSRADGFDPARDVYDCAAAGFQPPGTAVLGRYKNIIWNYWAGINAWNSMIRFTPESLVGNASSYAINYFAVFLAIGGHAWTLGGSDRSGGLAAMLTPVAQQFPMSVECEVLGNLSTCGSLRNGVSSMPYRDYCVTVLDKVDGRFRTGGGMPKRQRDHYDVLVRAHRDGNDALSIGATDFPDCLDLWEEVTKEGRRFNPDDSLGPGGLTHVELYDPAYWMERRGVASQLCFHPLYRMEAKSSSSALNGCPVALWVTKHADVVPEVSGGNSVAAPSVHFGFPLWFFRPSAADSIADAIFDRWMIVGGP
jgi:hypothetical protein